MNSDLLDEYCDEEFGHKDWEMAVDAENNLIVTFFQEPREGYTEENENDI